MKISVTLIVELHDPEDWTTTFGVEGAREIRQDVKDYIGYGVQAYGVFGNGEVKATITPK